MGNHREELFNRSHLVHGVPAVRAGGLTLAPARLDPRVQAGRVEKVPALEGADALQLKVEGLAADGAQTCSCHFLLGISN